MSDIPGSGDATGRAVGLAGYLLEDDELHFVLEKIMVLTRHVLPGAEAVSVTVTENGQYRTTNSTGPDALAIDQVQYREGNGPCLAAFRSGRQVEVAVGQEPAGSPDLMAAAMARGIHGVLSTPLRTEESTIGALNVYSNAAEFGPHDRRTAELLGEQVTTLMARALAVASSDRLNQQLRQAVATREIIGEAKGILMETQSCTRQEAFDILRRASQRENRKLRELAEELVLRVESRAARRRPGS